MPTCLVVDDSSMIRKIARRILEGLNFQVIEAEDGVDALVHLQACHAGSGTARLEHARDGRLPLPQHLRRMPGGEEPKVVFCTTENGIEHISRALEGGANEYIMKPFDKDIVLAKFQEVGLIEVTA